MKKLIFIWLLFIQVKSWGQSPCNYCVQIPPDEAMTYTWKPSVQRKSINFYRDMIAFATVLVQDETDPFQKFGQAHLDYYIDLNEKYYFKKNTDDHKYSLATRRWARNRCHLKEIVYEISLSSGTFFGSSFNQWREVPKHAREDLVDDKIEFLAAEMFWDDIPIHFHELENAVRNQRVFTFNRALSSYPEEYFVPENGGSEFGLPPLFVDLGVFTYDRVGDNEYVSENEHLHHNRIQVNDILNSQDWFHLLSHTPFNFYDSYGVNNKHIDYWMSVDFSTLYLVSDGEVIIQFKLDPTDEFEEINEKYFSKDINRELKIIETTLNLIGNTMSRDLFAKSYGRLLPHLQNIKLRLHTNPDFTSLDQQITQQWYQLYFLTKNILEKDFENDLLVDSRSFLVDLLKTHLDYVNRIYQFNPEDPGSTLISFQCGLLGDLVQEVQETLAGQNYSNHVVLDALSELYDQSYEISVRSPLGSAHRVVLDLLDRLLANYNEQHLSLAELSLSIEEVRIPLLRIDKLILGLSHQREGHR